MKRTLLLIGALLLGWPLSTRAQTLAPAPRISVIVPPSSVLPRPSRRRFEEALRDNGAVLVPAPKAHGVQTPVSGYVELKIKRMPRRERTQRQKPYVAELRVLDSKRAVRLVNRQPLAGRLLTRQQAHSLAFLAIGALTAREAAETRPPPPVNKPPEREIASSYPKAAEATTPTPPSVPLSVVPNPGKVQHRIFFFAAEPNMTWRSAQAGASTSQQSLRFGTSAPYAGLKLGFEADPFLKPGSRWIGFDAWYSFSYLVVTKGNTPLNTNLTKLTGTENRFVADVIGHVPASILGGSLSFSLGVAYEGFIITPAPPIVSSSYLSPRIAVQYSHPLFRSITLDLIGGFRPFVLVGSQLQSIYGPESSAFGVEAGAGVSGPLDGLVKGLRWIVSYDFLRYSDHFQAPGSPGTAFTENYNRINIGLTYRP